MKVSISVILKAGFLLQFSVVLLLFSVRNFHVINEQTVINLPGIL